MPPRLHLEVTDMKMETNKKTKAVRFSLFGNGIPVEVKVSPEDVNKHGLKKIKEMVNEMMLNALRIIKHTGDLPLNPDPSDLNKWSSTLTGIAIKPKNDEVKEFPRFL